jgi:DNA-binding NarL/FixJ family response regulator
MPPTDDDQRITVLVAHPDEAARADLVARLDADDELVVVGMAGGPEAVDEILELMPDIAVVASGYDGLDAPTVVAACHLDAPVITVVAVHAPTDDGYDALAAGATTSVPGDHGDLVGVVRSAWRGESHLSAAQARDMLAELDRLAARIDEAAHPPSLTDTEREVLERLAKGEQPTDIADEYEVTDRLVNLHAGYAVGKVHWAIDAVRQIETTAG